MPGWLDRIGDDEAGRMVAALEAGRAPAGVEPLALIAALARVGLAGEGPPLVRGSPTRPKLRAALEEPALAGLFPNAPRPARLALAAGLLQVFDFWDASHEAAQEADDLGESRFAAYWHAIAHRREPDASNALYWFRRVGRHPIFDALAREAPEFAPRGAWDAGALVAACGRARAGSAEEAACRRAQRAEMALLLEATAGAVV